MISYSEYFVLFCYSRYVELLGSVHGPPFGTGYPGGHMGPPPFGPGFHGDPMSHPPIGPGMPGPVGLTSFAPGAGRGALGHPLFGSMDTKPPVIGSKPPM